MQIPVRLRGSTNTGISDCLQAGDRDDPSFLDLDTLPTIKTALDDHPLAVELLCRLSVFGTLPEVQLPGNALGGNRRAGRLTPDGNNAGAEGAENGDGDRFPTFGLLGLLRSRIGLSW